MRRRSIAPVIARGETGRFFPFLGKNHRKLKIGLKSRDNFPVAFLDDFQKKLNATANGEKSENFLFLHFATAHMIFQLFRASIFRVLILRFVLLSA